MHQQIDALSQREAAFAGGGIPEDGQLLTGAGRGEIVCAIDYPAIVQGDALPALELLEQRAEGNPGGNKRCAIQSAGLILLLHAIAVTLYRVIHRRCGHGPGVIAEHHPGANLDNLERVIGPGAADPQAGFNKLTNAGRAVNGQRVDVARHRAAAQQARQAKKVIAMQVGNEDFIQLAGMAGGAQQLMLRAFAAVKHPQTAAGRVL